MRIALLCSRRAPGLEYLLDHGGGLGGACEIVVGLTSDAHSAALPIWRRAGVPVIVRDLAAFYARRGAHRSDLAVRREYDARTAELLRPFRIDMVVLSGYLHIVTEPLLAAYPGRILSVHDADLTLLGPDGRPRYPGLHATRDAIRAGETETRCSAHLVTADVDAGPVLARSAAFPVEGRHHYVQREWMMREAWGPLIVDALHAEVAV